MDYKTTKEFYKNVKLAWIENCPLCSEDLKKVNKVIKITDYWVICHAKYNYFEEENHLLVFPIDHKEFSSDLTSEELLDYWNIDKFIRNYFEELNLEYFSFARQSFWNRSLKHLHYHYMPWEISSRFKQWNKKRKFRVKNYN